MQPRRHNSAKAARSRQSGVPRAPDGRGADSGAVGLRSHPAQAHAFDSGRPSWQWHRQRTGKPLGVPPPRLTSPRGRSSARGTAAQQRSRATVARCCSARFDPARGCGSARRAWCSEPPTRPRRRALPAGAQGVPITDMRNVGEDASMVRSSQQPLVVGPEHRTGRHRPVPGSRTANVASCRQGLESAPSRPDGTREAGKARHVGDETVAVANIRARSTQS